MKKDFRNGLEIFGAVCWFVCLFKLCSEAPTNVHKSMAKHT